MEKKRRGGSSTASPCTEIGAAGEVVDPGDMHRWDAHMERHSSHLSGMTVAPMGHPRGMGAGRSLIGGPARYAQFLFLFIQMLSNGFEFPWSKYDLILILFQLKY
jgi:hypothetical protein